MSEETFLSKFEGRVDRVNHIITGVPLITIGEAEGHGFEADARTLELTKRLLPSLGLKGKLNHRDASGVLSINGRFKNPRIEGDKLRADWHLNPGIANTPHIESLAENQPEDCGISLRFHKTLERIDGRDFIRPTRLLSADLVDDPACNESLLSVDTNESDMNLDELQKKHDQLQKDQDALKGQYSELSKKHDELYGSVKDLVTYLQAKEDGEEEPSTSELSIRPRGGKRGTDLSLTEALKEANKPLLAELAAVKTKLEATETTLSKIQQAPVGQNQPGAGNGNPSTKTADETALEKKLKDAATELAAATGRAKADLANRFKRELGADWKEKLTELEAK